MRRCAQLGARRSLATRPRVRQQNKALSELIRAGRVREARSLFDGLPERNVVTWNVMIGGHVRRREIALARQLFDEMPQRDLVSYNSMLSGYAISQDSLELEEGRKLFDLMPERDAISWSTMISGYARNKRMDEAMSLFERMPKRSVTSWNAMITGFLGIENVSKAVELFEHMPVRDSASLSALISGLIRNGRLKQAEKLLLESKRIDSIECTVDAYNTLIAGYGQRGKVDKAQWIFNLIPNHNRNVVSYNSMIMAYVKAGEVKSARALFNEMPERDLVSWNTMITGYVQSLEMDEAVYLFLDLQEPDERSWNLILSGFAQRGEVERARECFEQMPQKMLVSWNTMIAGYEQNGNYKEAIELFTRMQGAGERPDRHTLSSVLSACAGQVSLRQGIQIHQLIVKTVLADIPINNSLVTMYSRCGNVIDARTVFDEMKLQRDVISWNAMIGGYAQHGFAREALELFREMRRMKVRPTHITFISVLNACGHAGLVVEGRRQFDSMVNEFGITPQVEHYASLVDLIGRHGQLEDAMDVINNMAVPPDRAVWGALLGACRVHNNAELARVAAEALVKIEPESSAPYVLLYNTHAEDGRWDDALEVRELMDKNRIPKQPGYSWIELHNSVRVFVAGDRSHPLTHDIYSLLESCNKTIKDMQQH